MNSRMFPYFHKQLLEIYACAKQRQPSNVQVIANKMFELYGQIFAEHCAASLQAYDRYVRLVTFHIPELDQKLHVPDEHWEEVFGVLPRKDMHSTVIEANSAET